MLLLPDQGCVQPVERLAEVLLLAEALRECDERGDAAGVLGTEGRVPAVGRVGQERDRFIHLAEAQAGQTQVALAADQERMARAEEVLAHLEGPGKLLRGPRKVGALE